MIISQFTEMKYTKDNIDGLIFRCENDKNRKYKIEVRPTDIMIHWNEELGHTKTDKVEYTSESTLSRLNDGTWIPVETPNDNFPIY